MSRVYETSRSLGNFPWIADADRPSSSGQGFPSRWATLPQISSGSPVPSGENQMMPYKGSDRPMEGRLAVAEKSNRALLDEVTRLQAESKSQTRRMEEILNEERGYRKQLENSLQASNDIIAQLANRVQRAEDRIRDEHSVVSTLVNQTKGMENALLGNQKEIFNRKDAQMTRMEDLRNQLEESKRSKDQLERVTYELVDEMRQLKSKVETQAMDFSQVTNELKNSTRRLEEDTRQTRMSSITKSGESNSTAQIASHQLRAQLESRLAELRDVLVDLRKKQEVETQERRGLEQRMQLRLGEMNSSVSEQARKRDEIMYALEQQSREKDHMTETEKFRLQSQIVEIADEVQRKINQREMKIKDDIQKSVSNVESSLRQEQEDRMKFERAIRDAMEERYEALRKLQEDLVQGQKDNAKFEKKKQNETLHKLNDGLQLLEKEIQEYRKRQEKVLAAEVSSRKHHESSTKEDIRNLKEKVDVAIAAMQQAISGITLQMATQKETIRDELKAMMEDGAGSNTRNLADMDSRLLSLNQRLTHAEETLEAKIQAISDENEAAAADSQNVRERVETITLWQDVAQKTLKELKEQNQKADEELDTLRKKHNLLKTELESRINKEIEEKIKELEERLENMRPKSGGDSGIRPEELENLQKGIRKLAESIQTVKTVLGMKIQSEQKLRTEQNKSLQDEVDDLRTMVEPLLKIKPEPAIFIKPEDVANMSNKEAEENASEVNKWNMYNTYRWLHIKSRWMYILWRKKARENFLTFPLNHLGSHNKPILKSNQGVPQTNDDNDRDDDKSKADEKENSKIDGLNNDKNENNEDRNDDIDNNDNTNGNNDESEDDKKDDDNQGDNDDNQDDNPDDSKEDNKGSEDNKDKES